VRKRIIVRTSGELWGGRSGTFAGRSRAQLDAFERRDGDRGRLGRGSDLRQVLLDRGDDIGARDLRSGLRLEPVRPAEVGLLGERAAVVATEPLAFAAEARILM
jgi:hypothetical protein